MPQVSWEMLRPSWACTKYEGLFRDIQEEAEEDALERGLLFKPISLWPGYSDGTVVPGPVWGYVDCVGLGSFWALSAVRHPLEILVAYATALESPHPTLLHRKCHILINWMIICIVDPWVVKMGGREREKEVAKRKLPFTVGWGGGG